MLSEKTIISLSKDLREAVRFGPSARPFNRNDELAGRAPPVGRRVFAPPPKTARLISVSSALQVYTREEFPASRLLRIGVAFGDDDPINIGIGSDLDEPTTTNNDFNLALGAHGRFRVASLSLNDGLSVWDFGPTGLDWAGADGLWIRPRNVPSAYWTMIAAVGE